MVYPGQSKQYLLLNLTLSKNVVKDISDHLVDSKRVYVHNLEEFHIETDLWPVCIVISGTIDTSLPYLWPGIVLSAVLF